MSNPVCKFCNNTDDVCCDEANRADGKAQSHVIAQQDEHHNNQAGSDFFILNGLLVAKDVPMPR